MCFCYFLGLSALLGVFIFCSTWMYHWVFLFLVQFEYIIECFYSLFNLSALLNAFVPCSKSMFCLVFLFIFLMLVHCCVFWFFCSTWINRQMFLFVFFYFSAWPCVYVPCLVWVHHQMFMFLVWHECINVCFCSLFDFNALFCVSIPCSIFKTFMFKLSLKLQPPRNFKLTNTCWQNPQKGCVFSSHFVNHNDVLSNAFVVELNH